MNQTPQELALIHAEKLGKQAYMTQKEKWLEHHKNMKRFRFTPSALHVTLIEMSRNENLTEEEVKATVTWTPEELR